jgi:outer membrane murein-binding lipoprotein Lpp
MLPMARKVERGTMSAAIAEDDMGESAGGLDLRVAKIESDVTHVRSSVANIEIDLRDMRKSIDHRFEATNGEFKAVRAEMSTGFQAVHAGIEGIRAEMRAMRGDFSAGLQNARAEATAESTEIRGRLDRLWDRVSGLQIMVISLATGVILVTQGSQAYRAALEWLSHLR